MGQVVRGAIALGAGAFLAAAVTLLSGACADLSKLSAGAGDARGDGSAHAAGGCHNRGGAADNTAVSLRCDGNSANPRSFVSNHTGFRCCSQ